MTSGERRLEAPHRRSGTRSRVLEQAVVRAYRAAAWILRTVPAGPAGAVLGLGAQASYLVWPTKRAWSNRNFGHVLGLPPDHPRVRRLALRAYRTYGAYLVELMRVPFMQPDEIVRLVDPIDADAVRRVLEASPEGGLILTVGHVGNNDVIGAAIGDLGLALSVVADDSSFPELFELLKNQRERWHSTLIPWRNLRAIFGVLRRREMLGLLVDWGYRSDGIPVQLFGAWTTLPAGPATLAAKTHSRILPIMTTRSPSGRLHVGWGDPITVASSDPAELQRATQAVADALADTIRPAPEQWYSFKPIWPETAEEAADLERRARVMQAGQRDPGPALGSADVHGHPQDVDAGNVP